MKDTQTAQELILAYQEAAAHADVCKEAYNEAYESYKAARTAFREADEEVGKANARVMKLGAKLSRKLLEDLAEKASGVPDRISAVTSKNSATMQIGITYGDVEYVWRIHRRITWTDNHAALACYQHAIIGGGKIEYPQPIELDLSPAGGDATCVLLCVVAEIAHSKMHESHCLPQAVYSKSWKTDEFKDLYDKYTDGIQWR